MHTLHSKVGLEEAHDRIVNKLQLRTLDDVLWLEPEDLERAELRVPEIRRFKRLQQLATSWAERSLGLKTVWSQALEDLQRNQPDSFRLLTLLAW